MTDIQNIADMMDDDEDEFEDDMPIEDWIHFQVVSGEYAVKIWMGNRWSSTKTLTPNHIEQYIKKGIKKFLVLGAKTSLLGNKMFPTAMMLVVDGKDLLIYDSEDDRTPYQRRAQPNTVFANIVREPITVALVQDALFTVISDLFNEGEIPYN